MATCDPQTLLNDGSCFLCLSEKELNVAVAQLLCDIASGGVPCACENLGGADSPLNNITPDFIGQVYVQDSGVVWQAGSLLSSSWTVLCDPSGGGGGMIWGPDATELDFFTWGNSTFPDSSVHPANPITSLAFPGLMTVTGIFDFNSDTALVSVSAPLLQTAGDISGSACDNLTSVDFSALTEVSNGNLDLSSNPMLTSLSLPALVQIPIGLLAVFGCGLTSLSLPVFANSSGGLDCSSNQLATLSLPSFTDGSVLCQNNLLTSLSFPVLVSGTIVCDANLLASISLPLYQGGIGTNFSADSNQLTTLDLPALANCNNFIINNNLLTTFNAPNLAMTNFGGEFIGAFNNALNAAAVEFLLHVAVVAGWGATQVIDVSGGTNAGLASLSVAGQADYATLFGAGVTVAINP